MATRAYYGGKDIFLFVKRSIWPGGLTTADTDFRMVACLDTNSFSYTRELKEVNNKCTSGHRDGIAGKGSFDFEGGGQAVADGVVSEAVFQELLEMSVLGEKAQWKMANVAGTVYRAGEGIITSYKEDANSDDPMAFTMSIAGLGVPVTKKPAP